MKKPKAPKLVTVAITTTITIIFWIFFTLYQVLTSEPIPSVDQKLLEPIDPSLDTITLDKIGERGFFEEGSFTPIQVSQPLPTPKPDITPETSVQIPPATEESQINNE